MEQTQQPGQQQSAPKTNATGRPFGSHILGGVQTDKQPREIKPQMVTMIERLLEKQGIEYYEKNVVNQLIEFMNYYTTEILQEAKIFREYAGLSNNVPDYKKQNVDVNDVKLAISSKAYQSFTRPLPVSVLKQFAAEKNAMDIPKFEDSQSQIVAGTGGYAVGGSGVGIGGRGMSRGPKIDDFLPKQEYRMTNPNIQIYSEEIQKQQEEQIRRNYPQLADQFIPSPSDVILPQSFKAQPKPAKQQQIPNHPQITQEIYKKTNSIQFDTSGISLGTNAATVNMTSSSVEQILPKKRTPPSSIFNLNQSLTPVQQQQTIPTPQVNDVDNMDFEDDNGNNNNDVNNHFFLDPYQVNSNPLVDGMMVDDYAGEDQGNNLLNPADELLIPTLGGGQKDDEDEDDDNEDNEDEKMFK